MKQNEKTYFIPKNLNDEFTLLAFYTIGDTAIIITLFCIATLVAMNFKTPGIYFVPVLYTVLRFRVFGYPVHYWARVAAAYLFGSSVHYNEYTLFEKERYPHGNDESA